MGVLCTSVKLFFHRFADFGLLAQKNAFDGRAPPGPTGEEGRGRRKGLEIGRGGREGRAGVARNGKW